MILDVVLLLLLAVAAIRGAVRGFVAESVGVLALVGGFAGALVLAETLAAPVGGSLGLEPPWRSAAGFVAGFFVVFLVVQLVGALIARLRMRGAAGVLNRACGAALASFKWAVVLALLLGVASAIDAVPAIPGHEESQVAAWLEGSLRWPLRVAAVGGDGGAS